MEDLSITAVSQKYNITPATLRYYEQIGLLPPIPRKPNGNRYYPEIIQDLIEMIICLRNSGVAVEPLIEYVRLMQQGPKTLKQRQTLLEQQRALLQQKQVSLHKSIQRLDHKINLYETGQVKEYPIFSQEES